jgi:hypothetical protein
VHTVVVNGRVVKHDHRLVDIDLDRTRRAVESTVEYLQGQLGDQWEQEMHPEVPGSKVLDNPYTYTGFRSDETHRG